MWDEELTLQNQGVQEPQAPKKLPKSLLITPSPATKPGHPDLEQGQAVISAPG